jgi:hypothetical protein
MVHVSMWAPRSLSLSLLRKQNHNGREHNPVPHAFHVGLCQWCSTTLVHGNQFFSKICLFCVHLFLKKVRCPFTPFAFCSSL